MKKKVTMKMDEKRQREKIKINERESAYGDDEREREVR